jgi:hypothetical protein
MGDTMNCAILIPSEWPLALRCRVNQALRGLARSGTCSFCGKPFKHNSRLLGGDDAEGKSYVLAGECCIDWMMKNWKNSRTVALGLYSDRPYGFLSRIGPETLLTNEQIFSAIALFQKTIAAADEQIGGAKRHSDGPYDRH